MDIDFSINKKLAITVISMLFVIILYTNLVMIIWNNVIIKKFPNCNIQPLSLMESFAIALFVAVLHSSSHLLTIFTKSMKF